MVIFEALNALYGDCLLLRYSGTDHKERLWIIDGGPKSEKVDGTPLACWKDVLLPRLKAIHPKVPVPVALGMVSHIDDDHINGIQKLTNTLISASPARPAVVRFDRFWFNSFDKLVGPKPAGLLAEVASVEPASLFNEFFPPVPDEHGQLVMESIPQGMALASDLRTLGLEGNVPVNGLVAAKKGQKQFDIEGAKVTVIGPLKSRIEGLRAAWAEALQKPDKGAREAALQELFLPTKKLDKSVPNLSSIVLLVEVGGRKLLLTGDANGNDIVSGWTELALGDGPVSVDLLKMPHHGSIRNTTSAFLEFFVADHYVFSANGKYDNPDAATVEALVKLQGKRKIVLYFTNLAITWSAPYTLEKEGAEVSNLSELLVELHKAYPGPWTSSARKPGDLSVVVDLS